MRNLCLIFTFFCGFLSQAYDYKNNNYTWEDKPSFAELTQEESEEPYVTIKDYRSFEYRMTNGLLSLFEIKHKIIKVNDNRGIEYNNKVYLQVGEAEILEIKGRSISPSGKIIEVAQDDIKDVKELEAYGNFKIFALKGLVPGSYVEYITKFRHPLARTRGREIFQQNNLVKEATFEVISPKNIIIDVKGYNNFPEISTNDDEDYAVKTATIKNIKPYNEEKYAALRANLMRVEYKLSKNEDFSDKELKNWEDAPGHFRSIYCIPSKKEQKLVSKYYKKLNISKLSEPEKIRAIENHLKDPDNFTIRADLGPEFGSIDKMLKEQMASKQGIARLFGFLLSTAGVNYDIVLTTDRMSVRFDPEFESWNYFDELLVYFPQQDAYLYPASVVHKLGMIPPNYAGNYGLFIPSDPASGKKYETKLIKGTSINENFDDMTLKAEFKNQFKDTEIEIKRTMSGHSSYNLRPQYFYAANDDREKITDYFVKFVGSDAQIIEKEVNSININKTAIEEPLTITGKVKVNSIIERAGKNYLFKIGKIIGEQVEMYQEKERQNDAEIEFPHQYTRHISFNIPDGYSVKGLEHLKINIAYEDEDGKLMGFVSDYSITGQEVKVEINEYYKKTTYPLTIFEDFRKVINAAADFNKIIVVFEKNNS